MTNQTTRLLLNIDIDPEADVEELEQLTLQLREELTELDVQAIDLLRTNEAPEGTKAGDPVTWGTLVITLAAAGGVLTTLINTIQAWISRDERRSVTLEIGEDKLVVTGVSGEEQQKLINTWLRHHKGIVIAHE